MRKGVTRENLKVMDEQILAAAQKICKEFGVTVKLGRGHYSPDGAKGDIKLELSLAGEDGADISEARDWARSATIFGLTAEDFGGEFTSNGYTFKMVALVPSRPQYPVVAVRVQDGKRFKFQKSVIAQYLRDKGRKVPFFVAG